MTKKLLSLLLSVLMVLSMATPALAAPLDSFEPIGEQTDAESEVVEEPQAAVDETAELNAPVMQRGIFVRISCDCGKTDCDAYVELWQNGKLVATATAAKGAGAYFSDGAITLKAFDGTCGYSFTNWYGMGVTFPQPTNREVVISSATGRGQRPVTANFKTEVKTYKVTYTDGVEDEEIFEDQSYDIKAGDPTPAFNGTLVRQGFDFKGWQPEVAETVTADVTYTAQWEAESNNVARLESDGSEYTTIVAAIRAASLTCTMTEGHPAQTVTILKNTTESVDYMWTTAASNKWDFNLTIDLNGKTVTGKGGSVFTFTRNCADKSATSAFYVTFTDSVGTGVVTGGNNPNGKGGAINAISKNGHAKLTINGGTYKGNTAKKGGAIATYENSTDYGFDVEINGGVITGNKATDIGGGIYAYNAFSRVVVNDGEIINNIADNAGDDIAFASKNTNRAFESLLKLQNSSWYHDKSGSRYSANNAVAFAQWNGYTTQGKNNMVYLKYVEPTYVYVTYKDGANDTVFKLDPIKVIAGSETPAFTGSTERAGYKFIGWQPALAEKATEDVTYTAQWEAVPSYKVTFNGNGTNKLSGTISGNYTSKTQYYEGTEVNLQAAMDGKKFTKDPSADYTTNYRQTGWNTEKDGSGTHYAMNGKMTMPAHDVTLYAEWEPYEWIHWNIQLAGEGGDYISYTEGVTGGTTHNVQSFKAYTNQYGKVPAAYYTPVVAVPKLGFAFAGWYDVAKDELISDKATLTMQDFRNLRALKSAESGSVIEARFVPRVPGNVHLVIYKSTDLTKRIVDTKIPDLYVDDVFTPNIADYYSSANGFEYVGWFNDGNFNNYKNGSNYTEAESITVSGQWQNVIAVVTDYEKVIVKAVYDGDKANAQTIYSGRALRGSNLVEFLEANAGVGEVKGYALDKWYNWDWYGHKVGDNATVNGWTNVYVTYTKNVFKVTYTDGVDGEEIFADQSYDVKYDEATPEFNGTPARTGYTFLGWEPAVAEKVTEDVTYTAKWQINTYTVKYTDGVDGEEIFADQSYDVKYDEATPEFNGTPARTGYTFLGWEPVVAEKVTANVTYVAQWEANTYTVTFNSNGGSELASITVTYGQKYGNLPSAGYVDGLQNLGWYLVDENGNVTDTSIGDRTIVTLTRNHELFQKREIKTPKVKLSLSRPIYNYLEEPVTIQSSGITEYAALKYSYQWYKDDVALTDGDIYDGATTANLTLKHDYVSCSGKYKLVVTITLAGGSEIVVTNAPVTAEATYDVLIRRSSNMLYYDANGGVGGPSNNSDYYDKENDRYIAKVSDINYGYDGPLTRKGYHFTGWNTEKDGSGETYQPGDFYVFDRQLSENGGLKVYLYAQWEACENHFEDVKVITEPTCTEKGLKLCRCTVCNTEYEVEIPALGHDLTGWIWNRTEHWKRCKRCGELFEVEKHNLTEWKNVVRNGEVVEEHHCTVCGFSECAQTIHIDGTKPQPGVEINPATGAEAPSVLPALAVLAGVAVILGKRK